ncbi:hypothetical protein F4808DRAFT_422002 [Astrocystis sublimbata]|nr:hypothetical protein F4808DRAFT_422002 [Astrocystis sublimbata]
MCGRGSWARTWTWAGSVGWGLPWFSVFVFFPDVLQDQRAWSASGADGKRLWIQRMHTLSVPKNSGSFTIGMAFAKLVLVSVATPTMACPCYQNKEMYCVVKI